MLTHIDINYICTNTYSSAHALYRIAMATSHRFFPSQIESEFYFIFDRSRCYSWLNGWLHDLNIFSLKMTVKFRFSIWFYLKCVENLENRPFKIDMKQVYECEFESQRVRLKMNVS